MKFSALIMSCAEREAVLATTLESLTKSGWPDSPELVLDDGKGNTSIERIVRTWRRMLRRAGELDADVVLMLEDDVMFGRWFEHNLKSWPALRELRHNRGFYASLYNPGMPYLQRRPEQRCMVAFAGNLWGAQALLLTPATARFIDTHWDQAEGNPDQRMPRLASRISPIYYHVPSLVDHAEVETTWGGMIHRAQDFDPDWRAPQPRIQQASR